MTTPPIDRVLARLTIPEASTPRRSGGAWSVRCPAHDDDSPSLSVSEGRDGQVLLHCHAGCELDTILAALDLTAADLFPPNGHDDRPQITATYDYVDELGGLLYQVVRFTPKTFRQRRPDGHGGWHWNLQGVDRVLYHLDDITVAVAAGETIWIAEGEKDADALRRAGVESTTGAGGAGKWRSSYTDTLAGATLVIVADDDQPGRAHARQVALELQAASCSVSVVLPASGKDAADHLAAGHTVAEFVAVELEDLVATDEPPDDPTTEDPDDPLDMFVDWSEFWERDRTVAEWVYPDVLARGRGHAFYAAHKVGKSLLMLWVAAKVATSPDPVVVAYLDFEMGEDDLYERLESMGYGPDTDLSRLRYALLPSLPPLDTREGAAALERMLDALDAAWPGHHQVVIIDTIGRAAAGDEDKSDTFRDFFRWSGVAMKRREVTWARLDHAGKDPGRGMRGSSGKGDDVDVAWQVVRTDGGLELRRKLSRTNWIPERVRFAFDEHHGLTGVEAAWPSGTAEAAALLQALDVPLDASRRAARAVLKTHGHTASNEALTAAIRYRRQHGGPLESLTDHPSGPPNGAGPDTSSGPSEKTPSDLGGPPSRTTADQVRSPSGPPGPSEGGPGAGTGQPCRSCGRTNLELDDDKHCTACTRGADLANEVRS